MSTTAKKQLKSTGPARIASVPESDVAQKYIGRTIEGIREFDIFDYARQNNINVLIEGPTGPGKTMASRAYAALRGLHFYAIPSSVGLDPTQLFGKYIPNEDAKSDSDPKFVWVDGPVTDLVRYGGVLLINEVNFLPPRVKTTLFSLLDGNRQIILMDHKGEVIKAHTHNDCWCGTKECDQALLVLADMNPDYAGTQTLNAAFRNRFGVQLSWDYSPDVEIKLVRSDTLRGIAQKLRDQHANGDLDTPVSTNMLMEFERHVAGLSLEFAVTNFINHFTKDEQAAVRQVFDLTRENLENDFADDGDDVSDVEEIETDDEWDWSGIDGADEYTYTR